jgi:glutathione S-transferase
MARMKPVLYVGNKNYSSWSLRPWLVLRWSGLPFETRAIPLGGEGYGEGRMASVLAVSPTGRVPALHLGDTVVCESLAIAEWAAETAPEAHLWPADATARAVCRAAACEMHSGFHALRTHLPCNIRRRATPVEPARHARDEVRRDVRRIEALWGDLRSRYGGGGPYLFGARPTIADAFFTPVATRFRTYGVPLDASAQAYADALLGNPGFLEWEKDGNAETWTMPQWDAA